MPWHHLPCPPTLADLFKLCPYGWFEVYVKQHRAEPEVLRCWGMTPERAAMSSEFWRMKGSEMVARADLPPDSTLLLVVTPNEPPFRDRGDGSVVTSSFSVTPLHCGQFIASYDGRGWRYTS